MSATNFTRVVHYYGRFDYVSHTYLVMEYFPHGSLDTHLRRHGKMSYAAAASAMYQLVSAVAFLHQNGIAHGDLHPGNVMVSALDTQVEGNICVVCAQIEFQFVQVTCCLQKLIDFGHSTNYARNQRVDWDIYDLGDLLNIMLPANHLFDPNPEAVAIRTLVSMMRGNSIWGGNPDGAAIVRRYNIRDIE